MNAVAPHMTPQTLPAPQLLLQMITGYWNTQCIYVVTRLGVADLLKNGSKSVDMLAGETGVNADYLYRVMRALAGVGIFEETGDKAFRNTPMSDMLRPDVPGSMYGFAAMMGEEHYQAWGNLMDSMKNGDIAFETRYGMNVFEYFEKNPAAGVIFNQAMTGFATVTHSAVVATYNFSGVEKIVDVGGGHGALLASILRKNPHLKGVLFDLPHVTNGASRHLGEFADRCEIVSGDFFQSIAPGGDAYILSTVIHDWSDELSIKILKNIHAAMRENGKLLLVEHVVEGDNQPNIGKFLDINMMVMTHGGRERSEEEFRQLYATAGFELTRNIGTEATVHILEGIRR